ncbi:MAG: DEAD/DEAH box helicase [Rhizobiales bacterium]|nr:DEAD/DEAH box helicase [Hyphomicrobiales bacterium]
MNNSTFASLGLSQRLLRALNDAQYSHPTAIQERTIPLLLDGADLLGIAQTGTGKTAAFTLPLLQNLRDDGDRPAPRTARALILAPTRELALQIADSIKTYGRYERMRLAVVMGGVNARSQIEALRRGVDILIATPGRLLDLANQRCVDLSDCEYLIIDEADRMLDMGFIRDVRKIVAMLPEERQTLLFSATMPGEITRLANEILYEPERVEIAAKTVAVERIEQYVHHLPTQAKRDRLAELLRSPDLSKVIVFTRTKRGADQVVKRLSAAGVAAQALHGNKSQNVRQRTLSGFRDTRFRVLVATDIAARGLDVDDISHVINYDLPHEPESYVHRIGRTARAGASGIAISFCDPGERSQLRAIERLIKRPLDVVGDGPNSSPATNGKKANSGAPRPANANRKRRRSKRIAQRAA